MFNKDRKEIYVFYNRKNIIKLYKEHAKIMEWEEKKGSVLNKAVDWLFTDRELESVIGEYIIDIEADIITTLNEAIREIEDEKVLDTDT